MPAIAANHGFKCKMNPFGRNAHHLCPSGASGLQALRQLADCRTAALGGHSEFCLDCGDERIPYNWCRNRHCPKCQARARWLERQAQYLLPVEYHHVLFTLPAELSDLALGNQSNAVGVAADSAAPCLRRAGTTACHGLPRQAGGGSSEILPWKLLADREAAR